MILLANLPGTILVGCSQENSRGNRYENRDFAVVVQWQNGLFPSCIRGFDSLRPLQQFTVRPEVLEAVLRDQQVASAMARIVALILSAVLVSAAQANERFITLSSTTSTQDSGVFDYILPIFKAATGLSVHVVAVGTGQALALGERGDADALLVHDRAGENRFIAGGFGVARRDVMYNDFVLSVSR